MAFGVERAPTSQIFAAQLAELIARKAGRDLAGISARRVGIVLKRVSPKARARYTHGRQTVYVSRVLLQPEAIGAG